MTGNETSGAVANYGEIANMAFKSLLERMANAKLPPREILLDTTLVVRKSTAPQRRDRVL